MLRLSAIAVEGVDGVRAIPRGEPIGTSGWIDLTPELVTAFADTTGDHQWIHIDAERAKRESPFGGPVTHGFLLLALLPRMLNEIMEFTGFRLIVNYGCDKVRFPAPALVGTRVRGTARVTAVSEIAGGLQVSVEMVMEGDSTTKPVCVAMTLIRLLS